MFYSNVQSVVYFIIKLFIFEVLLNETETVLSDSVFQQIGGIKLSYSYAVLWSRSKIQCLNVCHKDAICIGVSYTEITRVCMLSDKWMATPTVAAIEDISWEIYYETG